MGNFGKTPKVSTFGENKRHSIIPLTLITQRHSTNGFVCLKKKLIPHGIKGKKVVELPKGSHL